MVLGGLIVEINFCIQPHVNIHVHSHSRGMSGKECTIILYRGRFTFGMMYNTKGWVPDEGVLPPAWSAKLHCTCKSSS